MNEDPNSQNNNANPVSPTSHEGATPVVSQPESVAVQPDTSFSPNTQPAQFQSSAQEMSSNQPAPVAQTPQSVHQSANVAPVGVGQVSASQPVTPNTNQFNQSPQDPVEPVEYSSNPFIAAGKGLGAALLTNPVPSILIGILPMLILFGFMFGAMAIVSLLGAMGGFIVALIAFVAVLIVFVRALAGSVVILLESANGRKVTTREAMGGLASKKLTAFFFATLVTGLLIFIGLIFFVIPGIILLGRLSLAPVIVYAEGLGAMAAIKRSIKLTRGHTFEVLGAVMAQSIITLNGLLAPIGSFAGVTRRYYEIAAAEKAGNPKPSKTHWLNYALPLGVFVFFGLYIALIVSVSRSSTTNYDSFYDSNYEYNFEDYNPGYNSEYEVN